MEPQNYNGVFEIARNPRPSLSEIEETRIENSAYEYLCRLEEARIWMQEYIKENLPQRSEFEIRLQNGVYLAKLGNVIAPHVVPKKKIFDYDQQIYNNAGLHYRHTDNINFWLLAMKTIGFPSLFHPNSFDVYDKKNMPKVIYCIHALSLYLYTCGESLQIMTLLGKIDFSAEEINSVRAELNKSGSKLPAFGKIGKILTKEISPAVASLNAAIMAINIAISRKNSESLILALMNPNAKLQNVIKENSEAYGTYLHEVKIKRSLNIHTRKIELNSEWEISGSFLTHEIIQETVETANKLKTLAELKDAAFCNDIHCFKNLLTCFFSESVEIVLNNCNAYIEDYKKYLIETSGTFLNESELQSIIFKVNCNKAKENEIALIISQLNGALEENNYFSTFRILKSSLFKFSLHDAGAQFYHLNLSKFKEEKGHLLDINDVEQHMTILTAAFEIFISVLINNEDETFKALSNPVIKQWDLHTNYKAHYLRSLVKVTNKGCSDLNLSIEQIKKCISDVNFAFKQEEILAETITSAIKSKCMRSLLNCLLQVTTLLCVKPENIHLYMSMLSNYLKEHNSSFMSHDVLQQQINVANELTFLAQYHCAAVVAVNNAVDNVDSNGLKEALKTFYKNKFCEQCTDNYLKHFISVKNKKSSQTSAGSDSHWIKYELFPDAVFYWNFQTLETAWNIQVASSSVQLNNDEILSMTEDKEECSCVQYQRLQTLIINFQSHIRGFLTRQSIAVQTNFVASKYSLKVLNDCANPPLSIIQNIINILDISNEDYSEELKLQNVKGKVVQTIRHNQNLAKEVDDMDIKIGLLIRNRIALEDLVSHKKNTHSNTKEIHRNNGCGDKRKFFSSFSKKNNILINTYENLLYLLKTKPVYLARLIVFLPSNKATSLIESVIFSLYNYGSTPHEEYLLLKLLCMALEQEIALKVYKMNDMKEDHLITKIIISFYRKGHKQNFLKELLEPLILEVLNDEFVLYSTNPVEIYKVWRNEIETKTGEKSSLPHEISCEDALCYPDVHDRFNMSVDNIVKHSLRFTETIVNSQNIIPYGMRYASKTLKLCLRNKYPLAHAEEINKVIGHFIYYRYINPAIVSPDAFGILNEVLEDYQRLKLSVVANFLQLAVTGKTYSEEAPQLMILNPLLRESHENFMLFLEDVCEVKSLEKEFNIDIFSEATMPLSDVYLNVKELSNLHKLLTEKRYDLAPDSSDMLHEILDDFGSETLISLSENNEDISQTELCLSLKSKRELDIEEESVEKKLYVETKYMLITLLQIFPSEDAFSKLLLRNPSAEEEINFKNVCSMKQNQTGISENLITKHAFWKTLDNFLLDLQNNLNALQLSGRISKENNYQTIINDIAKDIVNRWRYRINRKDEIARLGEIQKQLDIKTLYYSSKLDYYNEYIQTCLENMQISKNSVYRKMFRGSNSKRSLHCKTYKYSGCKLREKGILLEINDLDISQLKNVSFEISPSDYGEGIFVIKVRFMGMSLNEVDIDIQDLLNLQYQGICEMNMFDAVKLNNNLLLHFLNSKFYGK